MFSRESSPGTSLLRLYDKDKYFKIIYFQTLQ